MRIDLNGNPQPEIETKTAANFPPDFNRLYFGGRSDNRDNWEARSVRFSVR